MFLEISDELGGAPSKKSCSRIYNFDRLVNEPKASIGSRFKQLLELERLILASAATEQVVTHRRMTEVSTDHSHNLTLAFQRLMKLRLLESHGRGRGTVYHLPGQKLPSAEQAFPESAVISLADHDASDTSLGLNERHPLGYLIRHRNPGPLGQVRVQRVCRLYDSMLLNDQVVPTTIKE